ncbi:MAG: CoA pyrophosphatase [Bacteroidota bacterium]
MNNIPIITPLFIREKLVHYQRRIIDKNTLTKSAVLIPIVNTEKGLELLFTKRSETVEHHKGQISFPGGATDEADLSPADTALRESLEEIGLERSAISILGVMDDLQTPTGFVVTPVIGFIQKLPPLRINLEEVAQVIFVPLVRFFDDGLRHSIMKERDGVMVEVFSYEVWEEPVWGATAFFVNQLVNVLKNN